MLMDCPILSPSNSSSGRPPKRLSVMGAQYFRPTPIHRLQLLPLLALDPAVLVLDPGLRQDDPRELRPRPNVEVRQLDLGSHFDGESNQIVEEIDSNQVSNLILCEVDRTSMDERLCPCPN